MPGPRHVQLSTRHGVDAPGCTLQHLQAPVRVYVIVSLNVSTGVDDISLDSVIIKYLCIRCFH